jgi:hypothetical protein
MGSTSRFQSTYTTTTTWCSCLLSMAPHTAGFRPKVGQRQRNHGFTHCKMSTKMSTKRRHDDIDGWYGGWMGVLRCGGRFTVSQLFSTPKRTPKSRRIGTGSAARVESQFRSDSEIATKKTNHSDTDVRPSAVATCGGFGRINPAHRLRTYVCQPWATPLGLHPDPYSHHHRQFKPIDSFDDNPQNTIKRLTKTQQVDFERVGYQGMDRDPGILE